jgi:hypothetical protein
MADIDPISSGVGLATGLIGSIGKMFGNAKANKQLGVLEGQDPTYQSSPYASQRLGLAETMLNSRMPGSATIDRGIESNQSNTIDAFKRGATDSSQFLLGAAGTQGTANAATTQEGLDQNQYFQNNLKNLTGAQEGMVNEGDKVFADQTRRFQDKAQIQGAMNANRQNTWQSLSNTGYGLADFGMNGGFSKIFGSGSPNPIGTGQGQINPNTQTVGNIPQNQINP